MTTTDHRVLTRMPVTTDEDDMLADEENPSGAMARAARRAAPSRLTEGLRKRFWSRRRTVDLPLSTHEIAGPLTFTDGGVFAWYLLGPQSWDFLTLTQRKALWDAQAFRYGRLAETSSEPLGRQIRIRTTTRPYPSYEWARRLDLATTDPLPQAEGGESWDDYLGWAQRRLKSSGLDERMVAMGVWIAPVPKRKVREEIIGGSLSYSPAATEFIEQLMQVDDIMRGPGFSATRATGRDVAFLFHRSTSMGVPVPVHAGVGGERWEPSDLAEFTERRTWIDRPFGATVEVVSEVNGEPTHRHVAVATMGVMPQIVWPENGRDPWMLSTNRLPFPVEWSLSGVLQRGKELEAVATKEQRRAEGIADHYAEHGITPPPAVGRAIKAAETNLDEITEGDARDATRWMGTVRCAVHGRSEDEALERLRKLIDHYGARQRMTLAHTRDQAMALQEFIPAEPRQREGYQRRMPVKYLASAMPNVDNALGTPVGPYFAYGAGSARRAALFDMHYGPESPTLNRPGLFTITAEPGGGKSVLIGTLAYNAARAGERTIILDPSGPLAALARLPELRDHAKVIDLSDADPGTLGPYQMIPDPRKDDYLTRDGTVDEIRYARARKRSTAERQQLMFDVARMWLSPSMLDQRPEADSILRDAIRTVTQQVLAGEHPLTDRDEEINPAWILQRLRSMADDDSERQPHRDTIRAVVADLEAAAEFPGGELIMPATVDKIAARNVSEETLVVITMPGLNPPPEEVDRRSWGVEERYTQPLLHMAAFFASRFIYGSGPRAERKNLFLDENHLMAQWGSGRALFVRLSRDSRKWNIAIGAASQHPDDHLGIGRLEALVGSVFVGRLTKNDAAVRACRLLNCPPEYATVIESLSAKSEDGAENGGEFVWLDPLGRVGRIRVDMDWHPSLREALVTTPGRPRPDVELHDQPAPFIDPDLFEGINPLPATAEEVAS